MTVASTSRLWIFVIAALLLGEASTAQPNLITNGSFETGSLSGWTSSGTVGVFSNPGFAQDGIYFADFNGGDGPANGVLSQPISASNGQNLVLSFYFRKLGAGTGQAALDVSVVGASTLLSVAVFDSIGTTTGGWDFFSYSFTADSSSITVSFTDGSNATAGMDALIDNIVIVEVAPPDADGDGVPDDQDICEGGDDNVDTDGDVVPDFCDVCPLDAVNDADGDGFCADVDSCPGGDDSLNADGDALPDFCDVCPLDAANDADGDGVCGDVDNCPLVANDNQADQDGDDLGDACDPDIDGDGDPNEADNCPFDANADQADTDGDGAGNVCDTDDDGDGVLDAGDACMPTPLGEVVNADGCAVSELCPCAHPTGGDRWKNHGAYVSCVAHVTEDFVAAGLLSEAQKDAIVSAAGQSSCGSKQ